MLFDITKVLILEWFGNFGFIIHAIAKTVVQFLSLKLTALIPVLLAIGGILFLKFEGRKTKQI